MIIYFPIIAIQNVKAKANVKAMIFYNIFDTCDPECESHVKCKSNDMVLYFQRCESRVKWESNDILLHFQICAIQNVKAMSKVKAMICCYIFRYVQSKM